MSRGKASGRRARWAVAGASAMAGFAATACAGSTPGLGQAAAVPTIAATPTPTRTAPAAGNVVAPLTGLPASAASAARPAVVLDLAGSNPRGLTKADVVFQEITSPVRYIAVYQSRLARAVGPITGTQPTDGQLVSVLHPLIGYDGGSAAFIMILDKTKVTDAGDATHPSLYTTTAGGVTASALAISRAVRGGQAAPQLFNYRGDSGTSTLATTGVWRPSSARITIPGHGTQTWSFDSGAGRWELSGGGPKVKVANVVIQTVAYKQVYLSHREGLIVPSARTIGKGTVEVLSGASPGGSAGTAAKGTWSKPHIGDVTNYFDASGYPMAFEPGPTWVILAPAGTRVSTSSGQS